MDVLAAPIWTWWIAIPLAAASVLALIAVIVGYVIQVVAPQYPPK